MSDIEAMFRAVECAGALHVVDLSSGAEIACNADAPAVTASVFKAVVGLEFYDRVHAGRIDPARPIDLLPGAATPGPTGLSLFRHGARVSLADLCQLMLAVSDNAATDALVREIGLDAVNARAAACGCRATRVVSDLQTMLDGVGRDVGFASYAQLLDAQSGALGEVAFRQGTDRACLMRLSALDPARASATTARDMTTFLAAVWAGTGAARPACGDLMATMRQQVTRRLETAVPDGGGLMAKSGGLFGVVRNEIALIVYPGGQAYAAAIFTRAAEPFRNTAAINTQMGRIVDTAIHALRQSGLFSS